MPAVPKFPHARVLVVGVGGLGCPALQLLAAAGVAHITLLDPDRVCRSNLHRLLLFDESDIGKPKAVVAAEKLSALFPQTRFVPLPAALDEINAPSLIPAHDWVIDATDGWNTKLWLHDRALSYGRPVAHAGAVGWQGQALTALPNVPGCLRCACGVAEDSEEASCQQAGIIPGVVQVLGARLAAEVISWLTGRFEALLVRKLLYVDAYRMQMRVVPFTADTNCPVCSLATRSFPTGPTP